MTLHDNLIYHLKKLCADGRSFGNRAFLLILNKFATNPEETLRVLRVAANSGVSEKQLKFVSSQKNYYFKLTILGTEQS